MRAINIGRVILGGLVAGLVLNLFAVVCGMTVLAEDQREFVTRLHLDEAVVTSTGSMVSWILVDFIYGLLIVWTYAAIRPRFGPGPRTAIIAGLLLYAIVTVVLYGFMGMGVFTRAGFALNAACQLVAVVVASLAGGALYKEA